MRLLALLLVIVLSGGCTHECASQITVAVDSGTRIQACFTPGEDCMGLLVGQINAAQKSIEVQAYSFTSYKIAKALIAAENRGVTVEVILDKSQFDGQHFSVAPYLYKHGIILYQDNTVTIAHNKVMIFDNRVIETGSFNFTKAAETQNAENMLIIDNSAVAEAYLKNWQVRKIQSLLVEKNNFKN